jgi:hypothetical protein
MKLKSKWKYLACDREGFYLCTVKPAWHAHDREWFTNKQFTPVPENVFRLPRRKYAVWLLKDMTVVDRAPRGR